LQLALNG